jgi:hypothetical protein
LGKKTSGSALPLDSRSEWQPSDVTRYKKYVRKFEEGSTQEWIDMFKYLRRYRQGVHGQVIGKRRKCSCL